MIQSRVWIMSSSSPFFGETGRTVTVNRAVWRFPSASVTVSDAEYVPGRGGDGVPDGDRDGGRAGVAGAVRDREGRGVRARSRIGVGRGDPAPRHPVAEVPGVRGDPQVVRRGRGVEPDGRTLIRRAAQSRVRHGG